MNADKEVKWVCQTCGQTFDHSESIGRGYGHPITLRLDSGEYIEEVCGPMKKLDAEKGEQ